MKALEVNVSWVSCCDLDLCQFLSVVGLRDIWLTKCGIRLIQMTPRCYFPYRCIQRVQFGSATSLQYFLNENF